MVLLDIFGGINGEVVGKKRLSVSRHQYWIACV
jgi:hypothetical protein